MKSAIIHKSIFMLATLFVSAAGSAAQLDSQRMRALMKPLPVEQVRRMVPEDIEWIPDIAYRDGHALWKLDLAMPRARSDSPRPAVVIVHGGGWSRGDKRANLWARYPLEYAQHGFVAVSINYRLVPDDRFPACIEDVKTAVRWLRANAGKYNIDTQRIGAYGNSAGAHLALMLGLSGPDPILEGSGPHQEQSSRVQAVVASASPTDLVNWSSSSESTSRLLGGDPADLEARARLASPLYHVSKDAPPILLIHGIRDTTVPYDQPRRLIQALTEAGASDLAFRSYPDGDHGAYMRNIDETLPMTIGFLKRTLAR